MSKNNTELLPEETPMSDEYKKILYNIEDHIARITLNAPEKRNALSFEMRDELIRALKRAESDDNVSIVLIDGSGPSFCSGTIFRQETQITKRMDGLNRGILIIGLINSPEVALETG